jgi:hypothetical protein
MMRQRTVAVMALLPRMPRTRKRDLARLGGPASRRDIPSIPAAWPSPWRIAGAQGSGLVVAAAMLNRTECVPIVGFSILSAPLGRNGKANARHVVYPFEALVHSRTQRLSSCQRTASRSIEVLLRAALKNAQESLCH